MKTPTERFYLLLAAKVLVEVFPVDSWDEWHWKITAEDAHAPFFDVEANDPEKPYKTHQEAFKAGIERAEEILSTVCNHQAHIDELNSDYNRGIGF